jgi:topoisomerase IA-like protein
MRIDFDDGGYIEADYDNSHRKIWIVIGARHPSNPLERIVNSAEITQAEFVQLVEYILGKGALPAPQKKKTTKKAAKKRTRKKKSPSNKNEKTDLSRATESDESVA